MSSQEGIRSKKLVDRVSCYSNEFQVKKYISVESKTSKTLALVLHPLVLRIFTFKAACQFTRQLHLFSFFFGFTPFGWLHFITLNSYFCWEYNFFLRLTFSETQLGHKAWVIYVLLNWTALAAFLPHCLTSGREMIWFLVTMITKSG